MKKLIKSKAGLAVIILLVGVIGGAGYFFMLKSGGSGMSKPVTVSFGPEFTTNLGDPGHYARVIISADVLPADAQISKTIDPTSNEPELVNQDAVRNVVNGTFSDLTSDQLIGPEGQALFREKLTKNLKDEAKLTVRRIYLTEWLVQ